MNLGEYAMGRAADVVLIVDEDAHEARILEKTLQLLSLECEVVGHMQAARDRMAKGDFALVIANLLLPDGTGLDLLGLALQASLPVILTTSSARAKPKVRTITSRSTSFITRISFSCFTGCWCEWK